jgi:DNA processing protein
MVFAIRFRLARKASGLENRMRDNFLSIAVVGARRASREVKDVAHCFSGFAGNNGVTVVSGLALGCDTAAHLGCLEAGGHTVAVLPCGLNYIAPSSNRPLAKRIQDSGGSLVSEYSPETPPRPFRFVERNRVIAWLSRAVIVMEAEKSSGTMHTARFAMGQNKALACYVPESGPVSSGCRLLLENHGATPLRNTTDLESFLETLSNEPKRRGGGGWRV